MSGTGGAAPRGKSVESRVSEMWWRCAACYLWASPATLLGLLALPGIWLVGGSTRWVNGVWEMEGRGVGWLLHGAVPWAGPVAAMTLGHVVWARTPADLEATRLHERVHVRQYERWGPLFIPLYVLASGVAYLQGGDPYRDNLFEREAFTLAP